LNLLSALVALPSCQNAGGFSCSDRADRADLLTRQSDGTWPENPLQLAPGDEVVLASIGFTLVLIAPYRPVQSGARIAPGTA
jgi:hypothetical protein